MTYDEKEQPVSARQVELEHELFECLTSGKMDEEDKEKQAVARLSPKYEVRVQAAYDPVAEETKLYRSMAREIDNRYDKFVEQEKAPSPEHPASKPE